MSPILFSNSLRSSAAALVIFLTAATSMGDELDHAFDTLEAAIRKSSTEKGSDVQTDPYGRDYGPSVIAQLRIAKSGYNLQGIDGFLAQLSEYYRSKSVRDAIEQLRKQAKAWQTAKEEAFVTKLRETVKSAAEAVKTAKKPADLDETLRKLAEAGQQTNYDMSEAIQADIEKVRTARQFVVYWQNYLCALNTGYNKWALSSLQDASKIDEPQDIMPRSEVLARIEEQAKIVKASAKALTDIVGQNITLEGTSEAITALNRAIDLTRADYQSPLCALRDQLNATNETYRQYKAGLPATFVLKEDNQNIRPPNEEVTRISLAPKIELMRVVFPIYLGTSDAPKPDETIQKYLERMQSQAAAALNGAMLCRIAELQSRLYGKAEPTPPALQALVAARNQEEAGQIALAVISYQTALKTGGESIPAKAIGDRLDTIKAAHPKEYEEGTRQAMAGSELPPPSPRYNSYGGAPGSIVIPGSEIPLQ